MFEQEVLHGDTSQLLHLFSQAGCHLSFLFAEFFIFDFLFSGAFFILTGLIQHFLQMFDGFLHSLLRSFRFFILFYLLLKGLCIFLELNIFIFDILQQSKLFLNFVHFLYSELNGCRFLLLTLSDIT